MSAHRASQLVEAGVWLHATGDREGARRLFEQALKLDPTNARALQLLGGRAPAPAPAPATAPAPAGPSAPQTYASLSPPIPTGTLPAFPPSDNPFARPPALDALTDFDFQAPAPSAPGPLPYDLPAGAPASGASPSRPAPPPPSTVSGILQLSDVVSSKPAAPPSTPTMLFASSQLDAVLGPPPPAPQPAAPARAAAPTPTMLFASSQLDALLSPRPAPPPAAPTAAPRSPPTESAWDAGGARPMKVDASGPRGGDPFALVAKAHTPSPAPAASPVPGVDVGEEVRTLLRGAEDLIGLDDHSGALDLVNKALELQPGNAGAEGLRQKAERTLLAMYESKIGRLDAKPVICLKQDEIIWLNLDHRAGFVLAQIDGQVTYDDLFAICGMTRLDTARILAQLLDEGVIATRK